MRPSTPISKSPTGLILAPKHLARCVYQLIASPSPLSTSFLTLLVSQISIETGSSVEWSSEENYKFRLSAMGPLVKAWLQENPQAIQPVERYNEVLASLATPPADLSVSRPASRLQWGIPVPGDPSHTIYVWMDALTNYLAVTGYPQNNPQSLSYDGFWPAHTHLVGKDIIR
jgi:methionyl-tRNA synthetase